jgi:cytochrome c oxidase cbb3-type subunit III
MRRHYKYVALLISAFCFFTQSAIAQGKTNSSISNPVVITFIVVMLLLLGVIWIMANVLINVAKLNAERSKKKKKLTNTVTASLTILLLFTVQGLSAQNTDNATTVIVANNIGGIDKLAFYLMASVVAAEVLVILVMVLYVKSLLVTEEEQLAKEVARAAKAAKKAATPNWWDKINKLRPISQEAQLDLGHEYDGIRELNNRLPPWWIYGFYISILFAVIYLWRFHVSHNGPTSKQEYETEVAVARASIQAYLKKKGDAVDENTVTLLTSQDDIAAGKAIFIDPSKCLACHGADGGGNAVGPNLTDNYWLYGGGVKDIFKTIKYGTSKGMRSWKDDLSAKQMAQLTSYIKSIGGSNPANPKEPQGELYKDEVLTKDSALITK